MVAGEKLYPLVMAHNPSNAAKVTGMLLEMGEADLLNILTSPADLALQVPPNEVLSYQYTLCMPNGSHVRRACVYSHCLQRYTGMTGSPNVAGLAWTAVGMACGTPCSRSSSWGWDWCTKT